MKKVIFALGVLFLFATCKKEIPQKQLTVNVNPDVGGTVSPSSGIYAMGSTVKVLATPSAEYVFKEWTGGFIGTTNPGSVVMDVDKTVIAVFEKREYPLSLTIVGSGTVKEEIIKIAAASTNYKSGTTVRLTPQPSDGFEFKGWSGDDTSSKSPLDLIVSKAINLTCTFDKEEAIKFSTNLDTGTYNVIDTLPLVITVSSKLPKAGLLYSVLVNWTDSSKQIFKLDTSSTVSSLSLKIPGLKKIGAYSVAVTVTSKSSSTNTLNKSISVVNKNYDYTTKYTNSQNITLSKNLILNGVNPESFRIINFNGKISLVTSIADNKSTPFDYFRSFSIDSTNGAMVENTSTLLGGYYEAGFPKSPFWYEDLNGDGIKDLFISDHGKEIESQIVNNRYPGFVCRYFIGKSDGTFIKSDIVDVTTVNRFYHNSAVGDLNGDAKNDLVVQNFDDQEMILYINSASGLSKFGNVTIGNQTGSVLIADIDGDKQSEIISAPYIDRGNTPNTFIKKINLTGSTYTTSNLSSVSPFGANYGCYKIIGIKNPKETNKMNLFYFVEAGPGEQKIFRSRTDNSNIIDEISTIQNTYKSNGTRDYLVTDLNFDGFEDIFFYVNTGQNLNNRIWLNNGDNTFTNSTWEIDNTLTGHFIPTLINSISGRIKFLYIQDGGTIASKIIDVYTKKK
jgi:hypothetical protein